MGFQEEPLDSERLFTLAEATGLIPQLAKHLLAARENKAVLIHTKDEIRKACAKAHLGGGSVMGPRYIQALRQINDSLQSIEEMGVLIKDLDLGLCDFPCHINGRIVYLCWKLGEEKIEWWHERHTGFKDRQPLPPEDPR